MRKPETIEHVYLDFDSFFASVEQQLQPHLRGRPVGIIPSDGPRGGVIAASREAKAAGLKGVNSRDTAKELCPDIVLVPQRPEIYRRAHNAAVAAIGSVLPVTSVKSIDELTCKLSLPERRDPLWVASRIRGALDESLGTFVTASMGFAANPHLAKIAGKMHKPIGTTVWHPRDMPAPMIDVSFADIPGIGERMEDRLAKAGIVDMAGLLATQPKQMRALWGNVTGERMWYALHGYDIAAQPTKRGAIGHGRVLPAPWVRDPQGVEHARKTGRLLTIKAARRARREGYVARSFHLSLKYTGPYAAKRGEPQHRWSASEDMVGVDDDHACLEAFEALWARARCPRSPRHVGIMLGGLTESGARQLDFLADANPDRTRARAVTRAVDSLNTRYSRTLVTQGEWVPPPGGNAGGKIAFTRIPEAEDFW